MILFPAYTDQKRSEWLPCDLIARYIITVFALQYYMLHVVCNIYQQKEITALICLASKKQWEIDDIKDLVLL